MKKFVLSLFITTLAAAAAFGQAADDYKKVEGYVGYSNGQVDSGVDSGSSVESFLDDRRSFHGVNVSGVYNLTRYFGLKADVSATFNSQRETFTFNQGATNFAVTARTSNSLYNFLGGVQVKDNSREGRLKPFVHAMVGVAHARVRFSDFGCEPQVACAAVVVPPSSANGTGFGAVIGGGLDVKLNDRIQIRAFQVDYNPVRIEGVTGHNARFGAGIVF